MRTMYDSVTVDTVPENATMVAPYVDGLYANVDAFLGRFPDATVVTISVIPSHHIGDVYDCESGNGDVADIPGWVAARRDAGLDRPTVYLSRSILEAGRNACVQVGCPEPDWWVADWTGEAHEVPGAVAVQYLSPETGAPANYDVSAVYDDTWHPTGGVDPVPPAPPAHPKGLDPVFIYQVGNDIFLAFPDRAAIHLDPDSVPGLIGIINEGQPPAQVSDAFGQYFHVLVL